jgi:hypothetical protein
MAVQQLKVCQGPQENHMLPDCKGVNPQIPCSCKAYDTLEVTKLPPGLGNLKLQRQQHKHEFYCVTKEVLAPNAWGVFACAESIL